MSPSASLRDRRAKASRAMWRDARDLCLCVVSIYSCYLLYGVLQERIYGTTYGPDKLRFTHSLFLVCVQCVGNLLVALLVQQVPYFARIRKAKSGASDALPPTPQWEYVKISATYIGAMFASNTALNYVSYPTQALGKSCKMIPVMLMRILVNGKRYHVRQYVHVLLITAGIATFMLMKETHRAADVEPSSWLGLGLLFLSLTLDGFTGPNQERVRAAHAPTPLQMMAHMNFYAIVIVFVGLVTTSQLVPSIDFVYTYPEVIVEMCLFSVASAIGQIFIFFTLFRFDSLVLTTITTTRKFFTILFSVVWFGHELNKFQWFGVLLVFGGLGLDILFKQQMRHKANEAKHEREEREMAQAKAQAKGTAKTRRSRKDD